jgi:hypothetical protein
MRQTESCVKPMVSLVPTAMEKSSYQKQTQLTPSVLLQIYLRLSILTGFKGLRNIVGMKVVVDGDVEEVARYRSVMHA